MPKQWIIGIISGAVAVLCIATAIAIYVNMQWSITAATDTKPNPHIETQIVDEEGFPNVDWEYWQGINDDVIGWVTVPGTEVNYPIVQAHSDDPTFYLHHDIYRNRNGLGCPYLDAECPDGLDSQNSMIFGHHIKYGEVMFAPFADFSDVAYAEEHSRILLQTPDWKHVLRTQAVSVIQGSEKTKRCWFMDDADFRMWYEQRYDDAQVHLENTSSKLQAGSRIVTFCTCSYGIWPGNERTLVYGLYDDPLRAEPDSGTL